MKKTSLYSIFIPALLGFWPLLLSSQTSRPTDLQRFPTFSYITLIEGKNKGEINDSISEQSRIVFRDALSTFNLPISGEIEPSDTNLMHGLENEIGYLFYNSQWKKTRETLQLTPLVDSLLEANGKRYGLLTVTTGFTRSKGNYGKQIAKGAAVGILTLGMYTESPIKANSTLYFMIVDAEKNKIVFYKTSILNKEPLVKEILIKQIKKLFTGYYW